ncbi:hypothetical protein [Agrobacterium tumefaciens]|uniref:Uncharacterized protein n=1 Tax=Agrobacterium tumefaciens TaxID=358 RepID=A0A176WW69_AGRTU|nr:hypothetical protein [Agrobacterium tumefaciens]OAE37642.1 hypothetical protein A7J57_08675 [Agrobacterium tumefaciens]
MALELSPLQKFGEWMPDRGLLNNPGATEAKNVVAVGDDYAPVETVTEETSALPAECLGKFGCYDKNGNPFTFAGTATKLYRLVGTAWTDVSKAAGYNTTGDNRWRFAQFGDYVVATNYIDAMQVFNMSSSTLFADLTGSPPRCKYLAVVNNFLFAINTTDPVDGAVNYRDWWCGIDNINSWTPNVQTQADRQDTPGYGQSFGIVGSQNTAIKFMSEGIFRLDYVGPAPIFTFSLVEPNRGTQIPGSIAAYSNFVFYLGEDGFNLFDGQSSRPIGDQKVDNWFKNRLDTNNVHKVQSVINPRRKQYMLAFPSVGGTGVCDTILVYNWTTGRWSYIEQIVEAFSRVYSQSVLADTVSTLADTLDLLADGASFAGGRALLGVIGPGRRLGYFAGPNRPAVIETTEVRLNPTGRAYVGTVYPVADCDAMQVELLSRDKQTAVASGSGLMAIEEATGEVGFHVDATYHRVRVALSGNWSRAQGVQVGFRATGR